MASREYVPDYLLYDNNNVNASENTIILDGLRADYNAHTWKEERQFDATCKVWYMNFTSELGTVSVTVSLECVCTCAGPRTVVFKPTVPTAHRVQRNLDDPPESWRDFLTELIDDAFVTVAGKEIRFQDM